MEYEATRKKEAGHANEIEITDEVIEAGLDAIRQDSERNPKDHRSPARR
ncbi:hypothetical protein [Rhizobium leguminosarum]|nr:hypothetical protein [Rhizobium leguminosarum]